MTHIRIGFGRRARSIRLADRRRRRGPAPGFASVRGCAGAPSLVRERSTLLRPGCRAPDRTPGNHARLLQLLVGGRGHHPQVGRDSLSAPRTSLSPAITG